MPAELFNYEFEVYHEACVHTPFFPLDGLGSYNPR